MLIATSKPYPNGVLGSAKCGSSGHELGACVVTPVCSQSKKVAVPESRTL